MQTLGTIIFLMNFEYAFGGLVVTPKNNAVIAGRQMSMECSTGNHARVRQWILFNTKEETINVYRYIPPNNGHSEQEIFHSNFSQFGHQMDSNGTSVLYTNKTRLSDAGVYTCDSDTDFSAHLVVFESESLCETNMTTNVSELLVDGYRIWMRCSVNFSGFWTPRVEWRQHWKDGKHAVVNHNLTNSVGFPSGSILTSEFTAVINVTSNGSFFSNSVYFMGYENKVKVNATNIPTFKYTWNSSAIRLKSDSKAGGPTTTNTKSDGGRYFFISLVVFSASILLFVIIAVALYIYFKRKSTDRNIVGRPLEEFPARGDYSEVGDIGVSVFRHEPDRSATEFNRRDGRMNGLSLNSPPEVPVFERVNKKISGSNTEVSKTAGDAVKKRANTPPSNRKVVGADGTEYLDVNGAKHLIQSRRPAPPLPNQPSKFDRSQYAYMDHTFREKP